MDYLVTKLKLEIYKKLGFHIQKQSDVRYLHEQISVSVLHPIGFNTLRRFFDFLPSAEPQFKTLDALSEYIGYASFAKFSEFVNKDENWNIWTFIADFENTNSISSEMLERLIKLKPHSDYIYYISVLIKSFIRRGRVDLLKVIFAKRPYPLLFKKDDIDSQEILDILKIAYAVGGVLRTLTRPQYEKLAPLLSDEYVFKTTVLGFYIDYSNFNGYYGFFINNRLLLDHKPDHQIFVNLLSNYHLFLSGKSTFKAYNPDISNLELYPTLLGRLLGYQIITTHFKEVQPTQSLVNQIVDIAKGKHISVFFIEVFPALIFTKSIDDIKHIFSIFYDDLFETGDWVYYTTQNTYLISSAFVEIKNKNYVKAEHYLELVSLDGSKTNSYYAYLKLFFLIASYQLEKQTTSYRLILSELEVEYLELVKLTGFKRFKLALLKRYF
nr:hypothetical protein [uncultured bacterium]